MTWQELLDSGRIHPHRPSKRELDDLRAVVSRDLADAAVIGLSADRRFAIAYNAVLQLAKMAIACAGYRVAARPGHHQATFAALELALGKSAAILVIYFDACRRKRNAVDYDVAHVVTETETEELVRKAREFRELVEGWIASHYPQFAA